MTDDNEKREAVLDQLVAEAQGSGEYWTHDGNDWIKHNSVAHLAKLNAAYNEGFKVGLEAAKREDAG